MKKLRKMFGEWNQPEIQELVKLIETQSKATLAAWCINYVEANYLPIFEKANPKDLRPRNTIAAARAWLRGEKKLPEVKNIILNECHAAARELELDPVNQAAARAIGQACSTIHAATHSIGIAFYGAAVMAYSTAGLNADAETYNKIAASEFVRITEALKKIAVKNEPNPAKVNWRC